MTSPSFPGALDALANPGPTTETDDAGFELDIVVARLQNCLMAIEGKLGIGSGGPPASAAVLRRSGTGASLWGQVLNVDIAANNVTPDKVFGGGAGFANTVLRTTDGTTTLFGKATALDLAVGAATAIVYGNATVSDYATSSATPNLIEGCQISYGNGTGAVTTGVLMFNGSMSLSLAGSAGFVGLYVNGGLVTQRQFNCIIVGADEVIIVACQVAIPSAAVLFEARFSVTAGGTLTNHSTYRNYVLVDYKR